MAHMISKIMLMGLGTAAGYSILSHKAKKNINKLANDQADKAAMDSFPASDPPAWNKTSM